jgi:KUP system potassium uptake protein
MNTENPRSWIAPSLVIGALGVVYGDIGTSPLYALRECFGGAQPLAVTRDNVLGVLSLIIWSLVAVVAVKYMAFVMRASNQGEGGILALLALVVPDRDDSRRRTRIFLLVGVCGAALLYGDGIITPAVTVLSAVEGLNVATHTHVFEPYVVPVSVAILVGLFAVQRHGTEKVGGAFGPVMVVWFVALALLGLRGIWARPEVLAAVNPWYALAFCMHSGWTAFVVLGSVFLAVTGTEALYADMGHFGARPIRQAWFSLVMPALVLNYLGQGGKLLESPTATSNPFFLLAPSWAQYPLVVLSTFAAIIASQALISGAYSLTMQSVLLGFLPRLAVKHTSPELQGQIYVPLTNWLLMVACVALVLGFGSSSRLAAAYGIAVTLTMITTSLLFGFAARRLWAWPWWKIGLWTGCFLALELMFCGANLLKVAHGGWVPLVIGAMIFAVMTTWRKGRRLLRDRLAGSSLPLDVFLGEVKSYAGVRVRGTAVFMSGKPQGTPVALLHNLKHNKVLHEQNILLTIVPHGVARVDPANRVRVEPLSGGFFRVEGHYGYMDRPDVPQLLKACRDHGLTAKAPDTSYFLSSESIVPGKHRAMARWREWLFALLSRNAQRATAFFNLPPNRVVELGMQIEL